MAKGPSLVERIHRMLIESGRDHPRSEIRAALNITPGQCDAALDILCRTGDAGYHGVIGHRMYFAKTTAARVDRRGLTRNGFDSGKPVCRDAKGHVVRVLADPDSPPPRVYTLPEVIPSPTLPALEKAWIALLRAKEKGP